MYIYYHLNISYRGRDLTPDNPPKQKQFQTYSSLSFRVEKGDVNSRVLTAAQTRGWAPKKEGKLAAVRVFPRMLPTESSFHGPQLHFSWEKAPPGSAQQGSSLVISECVTLGLPGSPGAAVGGAGTDPKFLPAPSSQGKQQPTEALSLFSGHTQELHKPISPHPPVQDIPATPQGTLWGLGTGTATLWVPIRAQGQALSKRLMGQNQLKADQDLALFKLGLAAMKSPTPVTSKNQPGLMGHCPFLSQMNG